MNDEFGTFLVLFLDQSLPTTRVDNNDQQQYTSLISAINTFIRLHWLPSHTPPIWVYYRLGAIHGEECSTFIYEQFLQYVSDLPNTGTLQHSVQVRVHPSMYDNDNTDTSPFQNTVVLLYFGVVRRVASLRAQNTIHPHPQQFTISVTQALIDAPDCTLLGRSSREGSRDNVPPSSYKYEMFIFSFLIGVAPRHHYDRERILIYSRYHHLQQ